MIKVGINGFGRIGRLVFRRLQQMPEVEVVLINDLTDGASLAHLLKYDSVHGGYPGSVTASDNALQVDGQRIFTSAQKEPASIDWQGAGAEIVLECTGRFRDQASAQEHLKAGAKKVIISAPGKGEVDCTVVQGVNEHVLTSDMTVVSNASCTTNCLAPMAKLIHANFGIETGFMNTVHAYTADQNLQDAPHKDLRRARAAAYNMLPTTTGAAKATGKVIPELAGKLDGIAVRVPVPDGSLTDLTVQLQQDTTAEAVNQVFKQAAEGPMQGIVAYCEDPIVSSDIIGNPHSCIFDAPSTAVNGRMLKVLGWYDNEWGYACRTAELAQRIANR